MENLLVMIVASLLIISSLAVGISMMPNDTNENKLNFNSSCNIEVSKFLDSDKDGEWEIGEPGLEGWEFNLWNTTDGAPDTIIDTNVTDIDGHVMFCDLEPGYYAVQEVLKDSWQNTTPLIQYVEVLEGITELGFGNYELGHLKVCKYYDQNYDGQYDDEEQMIQDWMFNLWTTVDGSPDIIIDNNVTGMDGCTMFWNLDPGYYAVQELPPNCWENTTPTIQGIEVTAGNTSELWFGNYELGSLTVYKYYDVDYDGIYNNNDFMYSDGWTFDLRDDEMNTIDTQMTDENGEYTWECLEPGTYYLHEYWRSGWSNSTPGVQEITVTDGEESEVWFGNYERGNIKVSKFNDINMNGIYDEGEEMLSGWNFSLYNDIDQMIAWGVTNESGSTCFNDLEPGWYYLVEEKPCCWHNTTPLTQWVYVEDGDTSDVWFGNVQYGTITVCKYWDDDEDGMYDEGEKMLKGMDFNLWTADESGNPIEIIASGETGENGCLMFTMLQPGHYAVQEVAGSGWINTTPLIQLVELQSDEEEQVWFGNVQYGTITVCKYWDDDEDGEYDEGEKMLKGMDFNLWTADESGNPIEIIDSGETGEDGCLMFTMLQPGNYAVQEVAGSGWINTTPLIQLVELECSEEEEVWFGNVQHGIITVCKYWDDDEDGMYDEGEMMLEGWEFNLWTADESGNPIEIIDTGFTDESGCLQFTKLHPGHYAVQEILTGGWMNTTPLIQLVDLECSEEEEVWFGNLEYGTITVCKYWDDDEDGMYDEGEKMLEGLDFNLWTADESGNPIEIIASGETGDGGCLMFEDLQPGNYAVQEVLSSGWINTTPLIQLAELSWSENEEVWFGNIQHGTITVCKFWDDDEDGMYDEGEKMLEGLDFNLWTADESGNPIEIIASDETGSDGCIIFTELQPGNYAVQEVGGDGWVNTTPMIQLVELETDENKAVWFGNVQHGNITVYKYWDDDEDGMYDEGEKMLKGVDFNLWTADESGNPIEIIASGETGDGGCLIFEKLHPGNYAVQEVGGDGWVNTTPMIQLVHLECSEEEEVWFGNVQHGTITVCKFWDDDEDGMYDEGEKMLKGLDFNLWTADESGNPIEIIASGETGDGGCLIFEKLHPGYYAVQEVGGDGWINTTPMIQLVHLECSEEEEVWFGNVQHGNITVYKYWDDDEDGMYDEGEKMLKGVDFNLWTADESGNPIEIIASGETGDGGCLKFTKLHPGHYAVQEIGGDGWVNTTPLIQLVHLECSEEEEVWFGNVQHGNITVCKFSDINVNEMYDEGEEMLSNWTFNLWTADEFGNPIEIIDTGVTYEEGCFKFTKLHPGHYAVQEVGRDSWFNTTPLIQLVHLECSEEEEVWFGNVQPGNIRACKYEDLNGNSIRDEGEPWLENWTFNLWTTYENGTPKEIIDTNVTGECGCVMFEELLPGTYIVEEMRKMGWCNTTPYLQSISIQPCEFAELEFGNGRVGEISGMKYKDINADGEFDVGLDEPLEGWTINLWTGDEFGNPIEVVQTTTTDECGMYYFDCVCPGYYVVQEEIPSGWYNVTPALVPISIASGEILDDINYGNCMYKYIYGITYHDWDMDGIFDEGIDETLEGWEVQLWNDDKTEMIDSTYTLECGYYWFEDIKVGTYWVKVVVPEGWHNSTPYEYMFEITCCNECMVFNFGNYEEDGQNFTIASITHLNYDLLKNEISCSYIQKIK